MGAFLGMMWMNIYPTTFLRKLLNQYIMHNPDNIHPAWNTYATRVCKMPGGKNVFWKGLGKAVSPIEPSLLKTITHPILLIWGAEERFLSRDLVPISQAAFPHAKVIVMPKAGHLPFLDQPDQFVQLVVDFLCDNQPSNSLQYRSRKEMTKTVDASSE